MTIDAPLRPLLTKAEACTVLRVSPSTLERLVTRGRLAGVQYTPRGHLRFRRVDLERLVAESGTGATPVDPGELEWR